MAQSNSKKFISTEEEKKLQEVVEGLSKGAAGTETKAAAIWAARNDYDGLNDIEVQEFKCSALWFTNREGVIAKFEADQSAEFLTRYCIGTKIYWHYYCIIYNENKETMTFTDMRLLAKSLTWKHIRVKEKKQIPAVSLCDTSLKLIVKIRSRAKRIGLTLPFYHQFCIEIPSVCKIKGIVLKSQQKLGLYATLLRQLEK